MWASEGMTEKEHPPTARERVMFQAASMGWTAEFERLCKVIGRDPRKTLDSYDAEPWRWLIVSYGDPGDVSDSTRALEFPLGVRANLDATRRYVERPWWRRLRRRQRWARQ